MSRTNSSLKNLTAAMIGQALGIVVNLFSRIIFLRCLNEEYLGLNGLFTNILTIFSLVELGIGPAMNFSLYRPLAEKNTPQIKSIMRLYKRAYILIGCVIAAIGLLFTPLYPVFLEKVPDIPRLTLIYWLFVLNTAISYFFSYKRALLICDEKRYIATIYRYLFYFIMNLVQIAVLIYTRDYIFYLIIQVIFTFLENVGVSWKANQIYPYLKEKDIAPIPQKTTREIKQNIGAMLLHKIGGMVVLSTDNLILSKFVGLAAVGIYSNYYLITDALNKIISQVFMSITASIGNLNALHTEKDIEKLEETFERIFFLNFWIYGFCSCCLWILLNPFISLWLGESLLLDNFTVFIIVVNFYLYGMRKSALTFREATGAFYYDRWRPLAESTINITASIILAKSLGTAGVFLGTIISTLSTCIWIEPYVLFKHVFKKSTRKYAADFMLYTLVSMAACIIVSFLANIVIVPNVFTGFMIKFFLAWFFPTSYFGLVFIKQKDSGFLPAWRFVF